MKPTVFRASDSDPEPQSIEDGYSQSEVEEVPHSRPKHVKGIPPETLAHAVACLQGLTRSIDAVVRVGSPKELSGALETFLNNLGLEAQIRSLIDQGASGREMVAAMTDLRGIELLHRAMHSAARSLDITTGVMNGSGESAGIPLGDFARVVLACINGMNAEVGRVKGDGIEVLSATEVRGLRFRALFIAGLVEGNFPSRTRRDWIYPHEERERLKKYGLTLEDTSPDTLLKEEHYFYQTACRATERLYLTRSAVSEDGAETVESYYINELKHALLPLKVETEVFTKDSSLRDIFSCSTSAELALCLTALEERAYARLPALVPGTFVQSLAQWSAEKGYRTEGALRRIGVGRERNGSHFGPFDGRISHPALLDVIRARFGDGYVFSASQLGLYGKCPFKFFVEKVLKLEPRGEAAADLAAIDAGKMLHEILRLFFERHRGQRLDPKKLDALRTELRDIADRVFDEYEARVPPVSPRVWQLDREIRKIALDQFLVEELNAQEKTAELDVRPAFFELAFGKKGDGVDPGSVSSYLELARSAAGGQGDRILIQGRIDRVDVARDGTLVAYDYKLSSGATLVDMKEGRDLQLEIYLKALEQLFYPDAVVAGGGYYALRAGKDGRRNQGMYRNDFSDYTGIGDRVKANMDNADWFDLRGLMVERIWAFWDQMRDGRFDVAPTADQMCKHCDFSAVCRYDRYRTRGKLRSTGASIAK